MNIKVTNDITGPTVYRSTWVGFAHPFVNLVLNPDVVKIVVVRKDDEGGTFEVTYEATDEADWLF